MKRKLYLSPSIRVRSLEVEYLLGGSITDINNGESGEDGPGYGGGGSGPAYAPENIEESFPLGSEWDNSVWFD